MGELHKSDVGQGFANVFSGAKCPALVYGGARLFEDIEHMVTELSCDNACGAN